MSKKSQIVASEFEPTPHAIMRLNQRFNIPESQASQWVHRFLNDADIINQDPTQASNRRLARRNTCCAVIDIKNKLVLTVYQQRPSHAVNDVNTALADYVHPYAKRMDHRYTKDVIKQIEKQLHLIKRELLTIRLGRAHNKVKLLNRVHNHAQKIMMLTADAIDNLKTIKKLK